MFIALDVSMKFLARLVPFETRIRQKSASLGKQLADASESILLNLGEGRGRRDGDKRRHFEMAYGSAQEVTTALQIAVTKHYISADDYAHLDELLDKVRAMTYKLTH